LESDVRFLAQNTDQTQTGTRLNGIEDSIIQLQDSMSSIEEVILDDPTKALEMTLLKKDMDNVDQEVDRLDNWNKWIFGLMFTLVLAVLSLAASNFFQGPRGRGRR
jgi:hypothetical protein